MKHSSHLPIGPIRRTILEWEAAQEHDGDSVANLWGHQTVRVSPLERMSFDTDIDLDTLYAIRGRRDRQFVGFDLADRIVIYINPNLWHTDPELKEIYQSVKLTLLDITQPTTERNRLTELLESGLTPTGAAKALGLNPSTIGGYLKKQAA